MKLAQARQALALSAPDPVVVELVAAFMRRIARIDWAHCPHCGEGIYVPTATIAPASPRSPSSPGPP